ncbi:MAG: response regulator [Deltaproteobacteria bacterium]|nr:response regulator [Deltaproteobacteria bacterium]
MNIEGPATRDPGPVLVVDDEKFFQEVLTKILREEGYDVSVAASGREAISAFQSGRFKVVVLDLVLPDLMGTEVIGRMKEMEDDIAVIMVTAYASLESAIDALKAGAYDYIRKPIVREDLVRSVERAIERHQLSSRNKVLVKELQSHLVEVKTLSREKDEVFRILDEGLVVIEEDGRIVDLNPAARQFLEWITGQPAGETLSGSGFPLSDGFMSSVNKAEGRPVRTMVSLTQDSGVGRKDIELVGLSMDLDIAGRRFLLAMRDMTEIKDMERRRDEFLAIVTHDLRTPLTSLKGFVELLVNENKGADRVVGDYLDIIDSEADRMISLINDLLDLDRLNSDRIRMELEPISMPKLVAYGLKSMEGLSRQRDVTLRMSIRGDEESLVFMGDRRRILQVLINLHSNAIRFSPRGGSVDTVAYLEDGYVFTEILDEGPGIAPEERKSIFEKYKQVGQPFYERTKGSGLGLTIVKKIVNMHGGSVRMDGRDDKQGSRFIVKLPAGVKGAY